ncbi:uncharacterized protein At2g27730, mitochondrial-like [Zingiber officinale]|uniref:uncharacterized protein At2g27730, mitochondrial-like n=1 Tax=Zingiber officinale TaxID=94328 RepID=UPI001C4C9B98|nr:uncharacterized protein At2g27730, mitochondrial-like [Zingiber officinale]
MAMRSALEALYRFSRSPVTVARESAALRSARLFSDGKGKILSEEEKAAENIYIQKMERERMEKLKKQREKEKADGEKENSEKKSHDKN